MTTEKTICQFVKGHMANYFTPCEIKAVEKLALILYNTLQVLKITVQIKVVKHCGCDVRTYGYPCNFSDVFVSSECSPLSILKQAQFNFSRYLLRHYSKITYKDGVHFITVGTSSSGVFILGDESFKSLSYDNAVTPNECLVYNYNKLPGRTSGFIVYNNCTFNGVKVKSVEHHVKNDSRGGSMSKYKLRFDEPQILKSKSTVQRGITCNASIEHNTKSNNTCEKNFCAKGDCINHNVCSDTTNTSDITSNSSNALLLLDRVKAIDDMLANFGKILETLLKIKWISNNLCHPDYFFFYIPKEIFVIILNIVYREAFVETINTLNKMQLVVPFLYNEW
jgi:hypothetical protein